MDATTELSAGASSGGGELVLGRYRLGPRLGSGGFGTVFAAREERLGRPVAGKVIPLGAAAPGRGARGGVRGRRGAGGRPARPPGHRRGVRRGGGGRRPLSHLRAGRGTDAGPPRG